jgi:hypothetical protein
MKINYNSALKVPNLLPTYNKCRRHEVFDQTFRSFLDSKVPNFLPKLSSLCKLVDHDNILLKSSSICLELGHPIEWP